MQNSKFMRLLRLLNRAQIAAFENYVLHFYKNEKIAINVFELIQKSTSNFSRLDDLDLGAKWQGLYNPTDDPKKHLKSLQNTFSQLHTWLKESLMLEKIRQKDWSSDMLWLQILDEQEWLEQYEKKASAFFKNTIKSPPQNSQQLIQYWAAAYYQYQQQAKSKSLADFDTLKSIKFHLDQIGGVFNYKIASEIDNMQKLRPNQTDENEEPTVNASNDQSDLALKSLYQSLYNLSSDESEASYLAISEKLPHFIQQLDPQELHGPLRFLKNFLAAQMRRSNDKLYRNKAFELNKIGVENQFFATTESISPTEFLGIVNSATAVKELDWATFFIEKYKHKVVEEFRTSIELLSNAQIFAAKKQFKQALSILDAIEQNENAMLLHKRLVTIQCYMELDYDLDTIEDYIKKYKSYLTNRKSTPKNNSNLGVLNTLKIVKMLLDRKKEQFYIQDQIDSMPNLHMRHWLFEKLTSYKKR